MLTVHKLEEYCESLYQMTLVINNSQKYSSILKDFTGQIKEIRKLIGVLLVSFNAFRLGIICVISECKLL